MVMSRRDFTALAEWAGVLESLEGFEHLPEGELIERLAGMLERHTDRFGGSFKRETFVRHAERERDSILHGVDPRTGKR